jgi:hypothetical protein
MCPVATSHGVAVSLTGAGGMGSSGLAAGSLAGTTTTATTGTDGRSWVRGRNR